MKREMLNTHNGKRGRVPKGYSYTLLFFGIFVPVLRGHGRGMFLMWAIYMVDIILAIVIGGMAGSPVAGVMAWLLLVLLSHCVLGYFYNDWHKGHFEDNGFREIIHETK